MCQKLSGLLVYLVEGGVGAVDGGFDLLRSCGVIQGVGVSFAEGKGEWEVAFGDGVESRGWSRAGLARGKKAETKESEWNWCQTPKG